MSGPISEVLANLRMNDMNGPSKVAVLFSLAMSVISIAIAVRQTMTFDARVEAAVQKEFKARETKIVERLKPVINQMNADAGRPKQEINTVEDIVGCLASFLDALSSTDSKGDDN